MFNDIPPLIDPGARSANTLATFPGFHSRQSSYTSPRFGYTPSSPYLPPNSHYPSQSSPYQPHAGSTPYHTPAELSPWSQPVHPPWPATSDSAQPITTGYFGSPNHGNGSPWGQTFHVDTATPPHVPWGSPWNQIVRSTSDNTHDPTHPWVSPTPLPRWDLRRSRSTGSTIPKQNAHLLPDAYDEMNLVSRPTDWRPDYNPGPRSALSTTFRNLLRDVPDFDDVKREIFPTLRYHPTQFPVSFDLRLDPLNPTSPLVNNITHLPFNDIDFAQLATSPTADRLRLFHPKLPWYINIECTQSNGVTISDIVIQMRDQLHQQIRQRHFWNVGLKKEVRDEICASFYDRIRFFGNAEEYIERGICWIDFLGDNVIFDGLARLKSGMFEIKTRRLI